MTDTTVPTRMDDEIRASDHLRRFAGSYGAIILVIVLAIVAAIVAPRFFGETAIRNTTRQAAILGIVAIGQMLVLVVRCVDLSVSAVIGFTVVLVAESGPGFVPGMIAAVVIALIVGLVNGWLVTKRQVPPFVATFGMLVLLGGARFAYTRGSTSGRVEAGLVSVARWSIGPVSVPVLVWVVTSVVGGVFITRTVTGRRMMLAGANEEMGRLSGLPVDRYKVGAFVTCSLLAVVAGVLLAGSTGYVDQFVGRNTELDSITAALLGGASFAGGFGSIIGVAAGSLLLASLASLIILLGWNQELQLVAKGVVLVGALAAQGVIRGRRQ